MNIYFASKGMQKACSSEGFDTLADAALVSSIRCHELTGARSGQLAIDLIHPYRLTFRPSHNPLPTKADGGLDWTKVTDIVVIEVVDYH